MGTSNIIVYVPPVIFGMVATIFFNLWRVGIATTWHWSAGFGLTTAGFLLSTFPVAPAFDAFVSGAIFIAAAYCYSSAVLLHFKAPLWHLERRLFCAAYMVLLVHTVFIMESLRYQLLLTDLGFACLVALALVVAVPRAARGVDRVLLATVGLCLADTLVRAVVFFFFVDESDDLADFVNSAYNLSVHLTTITICLTFPFAALAAIGSAAIERHRDAAERDPLTGLFNRRGFDAAIDRAFLPGLSAGSVIVCDIDHFKTVNDSHGHAAGDEVLAQVGRQLQQVIGENGITARLGGEEFVAYLPDLAPPDAARLAETFRAAVASRIWQLRGTPRTITVSLGIAAIPPSRHTLQPAIDHADEALYRAKTTGRNRVVIAEPEDARQEGKLVRQ
ncbi:diguanylate cyclase (GGDEF)-like protein [Neorhizobium galegae]|uniref:GGDEF domain-containing protein n=1 Tax=Neorhizobium galegae TaxID=399 RepID=UPI001AE354E2|nr:GGDEF domain-containing protein [Neorhizobium galegae]MBP2547674.1 diguanylate cyclase (GGDEF)-like protein [Neorhizobium galegae]